MKLHDALRKIIREYGTSALKGKRLVFLMDDFRAFDDYPAMKRVMRTAAENGSLKELSSHAPVGDGESAEYLGSACDLKRSLAAELQFRPDLASYAVDSLSYALGVIREVSEPSYHGFDPFGSCPGSGKLGSGGGAGTGAGTSGDGSAGAAHGGAEGGAGENGASYPEGGEAASSLRSAAERGDSDAAYRLGAAYAEGDGVREDATEAFAWFMKAAGQGHSEAQFRLGEMCHFGEGCARDDAGAVKWWRKAAEQGHAEAECRLGDAYHYGDGAEQDDAEAERWYQRAAEHGSADASGILGDAFGGGAAAGRGVEEEEPEDAGEPSLFPGILAGAALFAILGAIIGLTAGTIVVPYTRSFRAPIDWAFLCAAGGAVLGSLPALFRFTAARLRRFRRRRK